MSTRLSAIPKRARVAHRAEAVGPDGTRATFSVLTDTVSLGYQSDYTGIPAAWYSLVAPGRLPRPLVWRYTGSRLVRAEQDYRTALAEAISAGWAVTVTAGTLTPPLRP